VGPLLILGSAFSWGLGSLLVRHRRQAGSQLVTAAYQMVLGGGGLIAIGGATRQHEGLTAGQVTPGAGYAFFHLLVVGSLLGYVAYVWLLGHVSAALVGTYAYVNPLIAVLLGWLLGGEDLTGWLVGGMVVILAGVALVRSGGRFGAGMGLDPSPKAARRDEEPFVGRSWESGQEAVTDRCQSP